jgi:thimet oligopeptidase
MDTLCTFDPKAHPAAAAYAETAAEALRAVQQKFAALEAFDAAQAAPPTDTAADGGGYTEVGVLQPLNELCMALDTGSNRAALMRAVHPDSALRTCASQYEQEFAKVSTRLGLSRPLYEALEALPVATLPKLTQRFVDRFRRDLQRAGVDQSAETRGRISVLREELLELGQTFEKNIREDVRHITLPSSQSLRGLPEDYIAAHPPQKDGTVQITTDYPDYLPFMSYALADKEKKQLYTVFRQRGHPNNEAVLHAMLQKRYALAKLLGFDDWASYITADKMIGSKQAATDFIEKINTLAQPQAQKNYQELLQRLRKDSPHASAVGDWQKAYLEELVKRESYQFNAQEARAFFAFGKVRQGLFDLVHSLFKVAIVPLEMPVWHPSVRAYALYDGDPADKKLIGRFYLDLHPRADKYKHAAAFPLVTGVAGQRIPEAALVCNFPEGDSALLEHDEVETFFHEFGHLLHHLFGGQQRFVGQSGIATEWDFVEAPSQMLEEWTYDAATLQSFATNAAGETINTGLIEAMRKARDFGKGLWVRHQMFYAAMSLQLHSGDPRNLVSTDLLKDLQKKYSAFAYVPDTYFQLSFGHLDGYSAIYYTYMWSLVIAKDLFSEFQKEGLHNTETAARYRYSVLAPGGSRDAADLVKDFLRRPFSFDAFAAWMNER